MSAVNPETVAQTSQADSGIGRPPILLLAVATGAIVTNLFAPQTLVALIGPSVGFSAQASGLVSMVTLAGYALGLFFLVPLADLLENRRLVVTMLVCAAVAAATATLATTPTLLVFALMALGAACSAIQVLIPLAASMAPVQNRGRVIGDIMGGVMAGILLSRPLASLCADLWGWRAFYAQSSVTLTVVASILATRLPRKKPEWSTTYLELVASLWHLLRSERVLQHRAATAALVMGSFSVFWTAIALRLAQPPFDMGQRGVALFALVGAGGAAATPLFGRIGDRGWTRTATTVAHLTLLVALVIAAWAGSTRSGSTLIPLIGLGVSAILLDVGTTGDQTLGRRAVNLLRPEVRGRLNAMFVGLFFVGGAIGSVAAAIAWVHGGWIAVCASSAAFALAALLLDLL